MGRMIDICIFVIDRESVEQRRSISNGRVNQGFEKKILRRIIMAVWMTRGFKYECKHGNRRGRR